MKTACHSLRRLPALLVTGWLALASLGPVAGGPAPRPNVLYIVVDDLNNELGCYGSTVVKSPNLDRLAARGVRFDRAYCNYPLCNPSRSSFLSGRRPETTHVVDNRMPPRAVIGDVTFLPEHFRQQGYRTMKVGKIFHLGNDALEDPRSWDVDIRGAASVDQNPAPERIIRAMGPRGFVLRGGDEDTPDGTTAARAVALLEEGVRSGQPFFLAAGFSRPHTPYAAPEKYFASYAADQLEPRYGPPEHLAGIPAIATGMRPAARKLPTERPGDTLAAYYASITFMDAQVGKLLAALDRLDAWDNTIVILHSDHGYHLGEHGGLWHKQTLFEESVRVPMIVAAPGRSPAVSPGLVELVDIYPTLTALAGLPQPEGLEGTSFAPLLAQPDRPWKSAVFTSVARWRSEENRAIDIGHVGRSVFDGRWRYTEWPDGSKELYDHQRDPHEYANLAPQATAAPQLARLQDVLRRGWQQAVPTE